MLFVQFYRFIHWIGISVDTNVPLEIFNALCVDLSILLLSHMIRKHKGAKPGVSFLLFNVLNPFSYILIFWSYTLVYSLPVMSGILFTYCCIKTDKSGRTMKTALLLICFGVLTVIGYFIRPTALIPVIAIAVYELLDLLKSLPRKILKNKNGGGRWKLLQTGIVLLAILVSYAGVNLGMNRYKFPTERNFPIQHWIMIGLHRDGQIQGTDISYTNGYATTEEMKEADTAAIREALSNYSARDMMDLVREKWRVTWSDGTGSYQTRINYVKNQTVLYDRLIGNKNDFALIYCQAFRILTIFLSIVCVVRLLKNPDQWAWIAALALLGGILFYTIWEAKNVYCVPFVMFLLYLSSETMLDIAEWSYRVKGRAVALLVMATGMLFGGSLVHMGSALTERVSYREYQIHTECNNFWLYRAGLNHLASIGGVLTQTFSVNGGFDTITLHCEPFGSGSDGNARYTIRVYNESGECLWNEEIKKEDIRNRTYTISLPGKIPDRAAEYRLEITSDQQGADWVNWYYLKSKASSQYEGQADLSGDPVPDLNIQVYTIRTSAFLSVESFGLLIMMVLAVCAGMALFPSSKGRAFWSR